MEHSYKQPPKGSVVKQKPFMAFLLVGIFTLLSTVGWGQTVIFSENMGVPTATTLISNYVNGTPPATFQNVATLTFTGASNTDVRTTNASNITGSSGGGNVFLNLSSKWFEISGINTSNYEDLVLSFYVRKGTNSTTQPLVVQYSINGEDYITVSYPNLPTGSGTAGWYQRTVTSSLPSVANLRIRFTGTGDTDGRLDDVMLTGTLSAPTADPEITLANNGSQTGSGNMEQNTTDNVLSTFTLAAAEANASLTEAYFTTSGNYTSSDITAIKLWANTTNTFATATQLSSYITTSTGSGDLLEYTGLSYSIPEGATRYFWLTADVAAAAVVGRTINVDAMIGADFVFSAGEATGSASAGGVQTIVASTAPVLWVEAESNLSFGNVCVGSNAATTGTFELYGVNLAGTNVTVGPLAGYQFSTDGVSFSTSLSIPIVGGEVIEEISVRFSPAAAGVADGNIAISTTGVPTVNVAVTGTGIAAPSITAQPANQTVVVGNAATFNVTATGATSYQWQENTGSGWNNISGATNDSYTTDNTLLGMNGYQYRVEVTNACGTTTSDAATLNVTTAVVYELITSQVELVEGYYVITNETSAFAMTSGYIGTSPDGYFIKTDVEPVDDKIINPAANIVWYIAPNGSGYTIYSATLDAYLHYSGSTNAVGYASSVASNNERWTFEYSASGSPDKWTVKNIAINTRQLSYNSGSPRFACYANNGQQELQLYRLAAPSEPTPAIAVTQGATAIVSGTGSYDFGNQQVSTSSAAVTFTITNSGTADLEIDNITLSGLQADQFSVTAAAASTVAEAGSTTFTVTFSPTSTGVKSATVTIENNTGDDYAFTVTGTGVYSTESDIVAVNTYSYTSNIEYLNYQNPPTSNTTGNVGVFQFQVRDGGASAADADELPTTLTDITFTYTGTPNTVAAAGLFQGNSHIATAANVEGNTISFTGLNIVAADDNVSANYTLRVSFGTIATDNEQLQFTVQSAVAASTGSTFAAANAGGATSSTTGDRNRIEVVADRIGFLQQPVNTSVDMNMTPHPSVQAVDVNGNRDLDFTGTISITSTGSLSATPQTSAADDGVATFGTINHTAAGTGFVLTATSTLGNVVSNPFDITTIVYANGDYRTLGSGNWVSNSATPAIWERLVDGVWTPSNSPTYSTTNTIYIQNGHTISTGGSFGNSVKVRIMEGGTFTVNHSGTVVNMLVNGGGVLNVNAALTIGSGGTLELEDNATLNYNHSGATSSSLFAGTEIFHPNSNFVVKGISSSNSVVNTSLNTSTFGGNTALFGNLIIDIDNPGNNIDILPTTSASYNLTHQDFIVRRFGNNNLRLSTTGTITVNIGGNVIVEPSVVSNVQFKTSGDLVMNIAGDMLLQGGTTRIIATTNAGSSSTVNLEGNLVITGNAQLDFNPSITSNQVDATLNIKGDIDVASTALVRSTNGNGTNYGYINFIGAGDGLTDATTQTVNIATTVANENTNLRFTVTNGAYVRLANQDLDLGVRSQVVVASGGTLDFGFNGTTALNLNGYGVTGTGFSSQEGATLKITSPQGIQSTSGNVGNIRTNTAPNINQIATFHYMGKENQVTGTGITSGSTAKVVIVELDNNALTLTLSNDVAISNGTTLDVLGGRLEIRKGILLDQPGAGVSGSGRLVMTDGTFRSTILETALPRLSNHSNYALTGGTVELNGNGDQILKGSPAGGYFNVAVTNVGYKTITSGFVIANNLLITDGVLDFANFTVNGAAGLTMTGGRLRLARTNATLPELTGTATPYNITGGTVELYGTTEIQTLSLRGTYGAASLNISYYNIELNAEGANVAAGEANVVAGASFSVQGTMTINEPVCFRLASGYTIDGAGTFDLQPGATLKYGGTITTAGNTGNIRTVVRNFPATASYGFVGSVNSQQAGDGLPTQMVNLYLDKAAYNQQVQVQHNITVTGTMRIYFGVLNVGENKVTIAEGGHVSGGGISNGWVHGTLEKFISTAATSANYEVGFNGYSPVSVLFQNVTEGGYMSWRARTPDHPELVSNGVLNPNMSINRYWTVGLNDISLVSYTPTFTFLNGDKDAGINTNGLSIGLYNGSWNGMYVGTRTSNSTQALNVMLIGDFAIAEAYDMVIPPANDNAQSNNPNFNSGTYVYPSCVNVQGTTTNATVHPATGKRDVWYQFIAKSNGVSIRVNSAVMDPIIYLFDANDLTTPLDVENLVVGPGPEYLNYSNLVPGNLYRIAVASASEVDGDFNICVRHLRIPECAENTEKSLCSVLQTSLTGAQNTIFYFKDVNTNVTTSYTSSTYYMTLSTPSAQLRHGATYTVSNTAVYHLEDGLGNPEIIEVSNEGGCLLVIEPHRLIEVRANQRCVNGAVLARSANLYGEMFGSGGNCAQNGYIVEFVRVANCAGDDPQVLEPITKSVSVTSPYISLNYAFNGLPLAENPAIGYWSVRWKPRYEGYTGEYGPAHVVAVNGTSPAAGMSTATQEAVNALTNSTDNITANIYPNPNNGELMNINLTGITSSEVFVRIMDSMGREVYNNRYTVDGSLNTMVSFSKPLAQGVYMVEFTSGNEVITQRMVVTK